MIQKPQSLTTLKLNGDLLNASDWNDLVSYVDDVKTAAESNAGSGGGTITTPDGVISVNSKGNVSISSLKHINLEPAYVANGGSGTYGDVLIKPGDDITLESHHRAIEKRDEITVKTSNGQDGTAKAPVKLLIISSDMTLSTKGKKGDDTNVMNVNVTTGEGKGYLKVRAQAIDLRCEEHGGVAIQPKGFDGDGNMNKIKFEHGGGDGLEFGTFNTEKTSIFTDEYRFNKDGVWKMATRLKVASGKEVKNEGTVPTGKSATGAYKYVKQADDFYDIINLEDAQTTTEAIIKTSSALNNDFVETSLSAKKNLKISTINTYKFSVVDINIEPTNESTEERFIGDGLYFNFESSFTKDQLKEFLCTTSDSKLNSFIGTNTLFFVRFMPMNPEQTGYSSSYVLCTIIENITPKVSIESENEVDLDAKYGDVVITSGDTIKCEAPEIRLNALNSDKSGGVVNFGATQDVLFINSKLTKGLKVEASANPTKIKLVLQNNTIDTVYWDETNLIFRVPVKHIYADNQHTTEITPDNYSTYKELAAYFYDGTKLPADYTCFIAVVTESSGTYTTDIYKVSTKGSSNVLSNNIKGPVGRYTSSTSGVLGNRVALNTANELTTLEFEFENYSGGAGVSAVNPDSFVTVKETSLSDIIEVVNWMKTNNKGPWAGTLYEYVDLGLPSGTVWAKYNIGATSETLIGEYYRYGKGANTFDYIYGTDDYSGTEYPMNVSVDPAAQVWGGKWRTPTIQLILELIDNTTLSAETINGVDGYKFTATNGNYIFLPNAPEKIDIEGNNMYGQSTYSKYMSSTDDNKNEYNDPNHIDLCDILFIDTEESDPTIAVMPQEGSGSRRVGYVIRPVMDLD